MNKLIIAGGILCGLGLLGVAYLWAKRYGLFDYEIDYSDDNVSSFACGNFEEEK